MASEKIKATTPEFFNLVGNSSLQTSGGTGMYFPELKCVFVFGGASNGSDMNTSANLATIPEKYRPTARRHIFGRYNGETGVSSVTASIDIREDGFIRQGATGYARSVDFWGVYQL